MATRASIGIIIGGNVKSIYLHNDGYESHVLPILTGHYSTTKRVMALMALGDLSVLGENLGTKHDFRSCPDKTCNAYGRDRGEDGVAATDWTREEFEGACESCAYLFECDAEGGGRWLSRDYETGAWVPAFAALAAAT